LVWPVDEDVADRRVLQEYLERAETECLVEDLIDQPLALHAVEQRILGVAEPLDDKADLTAESVALQVADARQVEFIDQFAVDQTLEFFKALGALAFQTGLANAQPAHAILAETAQSALKARHGANSRFVMLKFQISNPNEEPTTLTKPSGRFR